MTKRKAEKITADIVQRERHFHLTAIEALCDIAREKRRSFGRDQARATLDFLETHGDLIAKTWRHETAR